MTKNLYYALAWEDRANKKLQPQTV